MAHLHQHADRQDNPQYTAPRLVLSLTDFVLLRRLGDGSFSTVVLAEHRGSGARGCRTYLFPTTPRYMHRAPICAQDSREAARPQAQCCAPRAARTAHLGLHQPPRHRATTLYLSGHATHLLWPRATHQWCVRYAAHVLRTSRVQYRHAVLSTQASCTRRSSKGIPCHCPR